MLLINDKELKATMMARCVWRQVVPDSPTTYRVLVAGGLYKYHDLSRKDGDPPSRRILPATTEPYGELDAIRLELMNEQVEAIDIWELSKIVDAESCLVQQTRT